jgi:prepilin-type N-terminal cleavage/methylation domain-containing protein
MTTSFSARLLSRRPWSRRSVRSGFTLMELLVVITIIAVLASMLMPAIALVRGSAKAINCRANQRQVGMAVYAYAEEHDGYLVSATTAADVHWFEQIAPYVTEGKVTNGYVYMNDASYDRRNILVGCPDYKQTMNWRTGFGINERPLSPDNRNTTNWTSSAAYTKQDFPLARVTLMSTRILLGDVDGWSIGINPNAATWSFARDDKRHRKLPNWIFFDLHAAGVSNTIVPKLIFDPANSGY